MVPSGELFSNGKRNHSFANKVEIERKNLSNLRIRKLERFIIAYFITTRPKSVQSKGMNAFMFLFLSSFLPMCYPTKRLMYEGYSGISKTTSITFLFLNLHPIFLPFHKWGTNVSCKKISNLDSTHSAQIHSILF